MESGIVICFSGKITSGKTTLSQEIASLLRSPRVSFGEYVRNFARMRGQNFLDRSVLQQIGEELLKENFYEFCNSVLNQTIWRECYYLIVDGVRHLEVFEAIKEIVRPKKTKLVYIELDTEIQTNRIYFRDREGAIELRKYEEHSTERQAEQIKSMSDLILDGNKPLFELKDELLTFITSLS